MENRAIVYTDIKKTDIVKTEMPKLGNCEVLVNIKATALCSQEQRMYTGARKVCGYPCIGGHESAGVVVEVGEDVVGVKVGDHVVVGCGQFRQPKGNPNAREDGVYVEEFGTLSKYVKFRDDNVLVIENKKVPFEQLCLTEPVACVTKSIKKARIQLGDYVVVIGGGIMGLLHAQLAKRQGAIVIVSEIDQARLDKALALGADYAINIKEKDLIEEVKKITHGKGANVAINTTPIPSSWEQAIAVVGKFGRVIAYSSQHPDDPIGVKMGNLHSTEKEIIGTVDGYFDNEAAARMIEYGIVDIKSLTSGVYKFEDHDAAFKAATTPGNYRIVITE